MISRRKILACAAIGVIGSANQAFAKSSKRWSPRHLAPCKRRQMCMRRIVNRNITPRSHQGFVDRPGSCPAFSCLGKVLASAAYRRPRQAHYARRREVISQVDRPSSIETKIAPRSLRIALGASGRSAITCMAVSRVGGCNRTLPGRRSLSASP